MKRVRFGRSLSLSAVLVFFAVAEFAVVSAAERSQAVVGRQRGGYTKDAWSVYYAGRKVEGLSSSGFVDLGGGYGKDAWTVVYRGRKIEGAAAQSFEYVGRGRAKVAWRSYFRGRPESDRCGAVCDPGCPLGDGYAAECGEIYFRGRKVEGAAAQSFEVLGDGYGKDAWTVYYCGRKVEGAAAQSFVVLGRGYAKDAWRVYFEGAAIPGASSATFEVPGGY